MPDDKKPTAHKAVFINDVLTPEGVIVWPKLKDPDTKGQYADGKYKVTFAFAKDIDFAALKAGVLAAAKEAFGFTDLKQFAHPFRDGDKKAEKYPFMAGQVVIVVKSKTQPQVFDAQRKVLDHSALYSGARGRLLLTAFSYVGSEKVRDGKTGEIVTVETKGVTLKLEAIQFTRDGERIGGSDAASKFPVEGEAAVEEGKGDLFG